MSGIAHISVSDAWEKDELTASFHALVGKFAH